MKREFKKILLLRFSSLGDIVMTTAMIRCLRKAYPKAQIDMVVRSDFLPLIDQNPYLTHTLALDRATGMRGLLALGQQIFRERYDAVYDAHGSIRTRLLLPFLFLSHKKRFNKHYLTRSLSLTFKVPFSDSRRFLEKFIDPVKSWGVEYDGLGPEIFLNPEAARTMEERSGIGSETGFVGLIPSAQWAGKRWPEKNFRAVLEQLLTQTQDKFLVFGGPSDTFCQSITKGMPKERVLNLQGKLSLAESMAAVARCRYVIANDTGLMHLADALNVPSVLIFGPTSQALGCLPFHPQAKTVEKHLWCRPCSKNGQAPCIRGRRVCLTKITPKEVLDAALSI